jgi:hypothetical protein
MREVGMRDPRTRCRRSIMVSEPKREEMIRVRLPSSLMDRRLRSEACRQSKLLDLSVDDDKY